MLEGLNAPGKVLIFAVPDQSRETIADPERIALFAQALSVEECQLLYQIALMGRRDMPFAVDDRDALEMTLLRMISFRPAGSGTDVLKQSSSAGSPASAPASMRSATANDHQPDNQEISQAFAPAPADEDFHSALPLGSESQPGSLQDTYVSQERVVADEAFDPVSSNGIELVEEQLSQSSSVDTAINGLAAAPTRNVETQASVVPTSARSEVPGKPFSTRPSQWSNELWPDICREMGLQGMYGQLAAHCSLLEVEGDVVKLMLTEVHAHLNNEKLISKVSEVLSDLAGSSLTINLTVGKAPSESPAQKSARREQEQLDTARDAIESDPVVQDIQRRFGATLNRDGVVPNSSAPNEQ